MSRIPIKEGDCVAVAFFGGITKIKVRRMGNFLHYYIDYIAVRKLLPLCVRGGTALTSITKSRAV